MASRPGPERRLEAVFASEEDKRRVMAAAAAVPMHGSQYAAAVLLAAVGGEAKVPRGTGGFRGVNALRVAALQAQALAEQVADETVREQLTAIRDLLRDGLAQLT